MVLTQYLAGPLSIHMKEHRSARMALRSLTGQLQCPAPLVSEPSRAEICAASASSPSSSHQLPVSPPKLRLAAWGGSRAEGSPSASTGRTRCLQARLLLGEWPPLSWGTGPCGFGNLLPGSGTGGRALALWWKQQGGQPRVSAQPDAAMEAQERNSALLRCELEGTRVRGGHTSRNLPCSRWGLNYGQ